MLAELEGLRGGIVGLDPASGHELWRASADQNYNGWVIDGSAFYAQGNEGRLSAFNLTDGSLRWSAQNVFAMFVSAGGGLAFAIGSVGGTDPSSPGGLIAMSATDGQTAWITRPRTNESFPTTATANDDSVFLTFSNLAPTD